MATTTTTTTATTTASNLCTHNNNNTGARDGRMGANNNFRVLNELQQVRLQQPAPAQLYRTHQQHIQQPQPLHHNSHEPPQHNYLQHPFYIQHAEQQYLDAFDVRRVVRDENNPAYQQHLLQQQQQHQQYANQRYGIPLSIGFNIGSWCTRSWG